ncbi:hypothetical protein ACNULB_11350 [Clostridium perfringens]|uniref:hypothetical protein n=1 Tax=Clostridium perfringens TaxID=1502 RepID=UPI003AFFC1A1
MKKAKILLGVTFLVGTMIIPTITKARDIKTLYFRVPSYQGVAYTPTALKSNTGGYTVMNISDIEGGSYALDGFLVNSNGNQRGEYKTGIMQGNRTLISNWSSAKGGYKYRFRCINHNSVDYSALVTGSWSPDN